MLFGVAVHLQYKHASEVGIIVLQTTISSLMADKVFSEYKLIV